MNPRATSLFSIFIFSFMALMLGSCNSSQEVSSSQLIQKRKYTKGYHINAKGPAKAKTPAVPGAHAESVEQGLAVATETEGLPSAEVHTAEVSKPVEVTAASDATASKAVTPQVAKKSAVAATQLAEAQQQEERLKRKPQFQTPAQLIIKSLKADPDYASNYPYARKTPGLAIAGFICSIVGIFVAGVILGLLGLIFGAIALGKINNDPVLYGGRGFAIVAIILGIIAVVGALIVISSMT